jgi:DNA replication protein DnaC
LAIAVGLRACQQRKRTLFTSALDLLEQLRAAHVSRALPRFIETLGRLDLLVIDELGYTPMDDQAANLLFQLINHLYTRVSVIVTTNVTFDAWGTVFGGNAVIAAAVLDRLLHYSHVFLITGPSYRMKGKLNSLVDAQAEPAYNQP